MQYKSFYWLCGKDLELILSFSFRYALPDFGITNVLFESKTVFLYKTLSDRREYDPGGKVFKKMCLNIFQGMINRAHHWRKVWIFWTGRVLGTNQLVRVVRMLLEVTRLGKIGEIHQIVKIVRILQFIRPVPCLNWSKHTFFAETNRKDYVLKSKVGIEY